MAFWLSVVLCYLFLSRVLTVATSGRFRLGTAVVLLSLLPILFYGRLVLRPDLLLAVGLLVGVSLFSAFANHVPMRQLLAFVRIPIVAYLIYNLVWRYLDREERVRRVLRFLYAIAAIQLPIVAFQRLAYPWLPDRLKFGSITGQLSLADFGMGSFSGDASMAFLLVLLVVLLLFAPRVKTVVKRRLPLAVWLSLTVLFANSEIQHTTILLVWGVYAVKHLRLRTLLVVAALVALVAGLLVVLHQTGAMTFAPLQHTFGRLSKLEGLAGGDVRVDQFLEGGHAREAAIYYYLTEPLKWVGDGPGTSYNTATRERVIGNWGHVFTFYAEVGLVGLFLSYLVFFLMAFPIRPRRAAVGMRVGWVRALVFVSVVVLSLAKDPMGNSAMVLTYCIIMVGYDVLSSSLPAGAERDPGSLPGPVPRAAGHEAPGPDSQLAMGQTNRNRHPLASQCLAGAVPSGAD